MIQLDVEINKKTWSCCNIQSLLFVNTVTSKFIYELHSFFYFLFCLLISLGQTGTTKPSMFHIPALHVNFFSMWIKWEKRTQYWGWGTIPNFQATCFSIAAHPGQDVLFIITQALTTGTKPFVHNQCILVLMKAFRKERTLNHGFCVRFTR